MFNLKNIDWHNGPMVKVSFLFHSRGVEAVDELGDHEGVHDHVGNGCRQLFLLVTLPNNE